MLRFFDTNHTQFAVFLLSIENSTTLCICINGDFSKSDTSSLYSHLKSHDVKMFKFQILEILENEGLDIIKTFDN